MKSMINTWRHVFKLDPDRMIADDQLEAVCLSGTDAIMIGGSSGVTYDNTVDLMSRVRQYELPCVLEVSDLEAVVPGFDLYLIPMVLNAADPTWLIGRHSEAVERYGYLIPWEMVVPEGYIILNPESTAGRVTRADAGLSASRAAAYGQAGERLMSLPVIYVEYSGKFGDMELVAEVKRSLDQSRLFYGGGIADAATAAQAAAVSDTVIVGNLIYSDLDQALSTVQAVKGNPVQQG
ncbi:geranylgeranylglyceryl/heptaprenylglyceryl phosphate synthase [Paenibacillus yonginensis]|uniref:Heptaprenylglyceryl phosphate synthase n=1 Tax=Paenibacillus yonginensis TaxID=1462996 RepID=A0A1B1N3P7_9BACL|nr:heptaprenylglyceryl phosphate synthase [Paenibacillus yonginensis]ANS76039.1 geranylgeranylglyceryl/heptaprenylglyceryl phosphate synthase [Paenibacillus yonginensis]